MCWNFEDCWLVKVWMQSMFVLRTPRQHWILFESVNRLVVWPIFDRKLSNESLATVALCCFASNRFVHCCSLLLHVQYRLLWMNSFSIVAIYWLCTWKSLRCSCRWVFAQDFDVFRWYRPINWSIVLRKWTNQLTHNKQWPHNYSRSSNDAD